MIIEKATTKDSDLLTQITKLSKAYWKQVHTSYGKSYKEK